MLRPDSGGRPSKAELLAMLASIEAEEAARAAEDRQRNAARVQAIVERRRAGESFKSIARDLGMRPDDAANVAAWRGLKPRREPLDGLPIMARKAVEAMGLHDAKAIAAAVADGRVNEHTPGLGASTLAKLAKWMSNKGQDWPGLWEAGQKALAERLAALPARRPRPDGTKGCYPPEKRWKPKRTAAVAES